MTLFSLSLISCVPHSGLGGRDSWAHWNIHRSKSHTTCVDSAVACISSLTMTSSCLCVFTGNPFPVYIHSPAFPPFSLYHPPLLPSFLYPTLPYPTLPYPTLPYPTLPYPTLPYPTLPYPTLPYPPLPSPPPSSPPLPSRWERGFSG